MSGAPDSAYAGVGCVQEVEVPNAARLSKDGKVQLPADIRKSMRLKGGEIFTVVTDGNQIVLVPVPTLADLHGIAEGHEADGYRDRG